MSPNVSATLPRFNINHMPPKTPNHTHKINIHTPLPSQAPLHAYQNELTPPKMQPTRKNCPSHALPPYAFQIPTEALQKLDTQILLPPQRLRPPLFDQHTHRLDQQLLIQTPELCHAVSHDPFLLPIIRNSPDPLVPSPSANS